MKTSTRKYNEQYRRKHLYIDGYNNPEIVPACSEHKRCDICRSHVQEYGLYNYDTRTGEILHNAFFVDYTFPTCGKSYAVLKTYEDEEKTLKSEKSKERKSAAKNSTSFFRNTECEYFPCHKTDDTENFNCLFCYCPLYHMVDCPGTPEKLLNGIKDCTNCTFPHYNYSAVINTLRKEMIA